MSILVFKSMFLRSKNTNGTFRKEADVFFGFSMSHLINYLESRVKKHIQHIETLYSLNNVQKTILL